jgi:hypothetical protein
VTRTPGQPRAHTRLPPRLLARRDRSHGQPCDRSGRGVFSLGAATASSDGRRTQRMRATGNGAASVSRSQGRHTEERSPRPWAPIALRPGISRQRQGVGACHRL